MSVERVSPQQAAELLSDGYVYLDVRSAPEFEQGHPEGALNIPLLNADPARGMLPNPDFLKVAEKVLPKDARIVVGCMSGHRSFRAAQVLLDNGWSDVVDQRAGFGGARDPATGAVTEAGWHETGLPTADGQPEGQCYQDLRTKAGV